MTLTVTAHDGTPLTVNVHERANPTMTIVLLHGFCMHSGSWARTRSDLADAYPNARLVTYDHRGHGQSADGPPRSHTLDTLADDLADVLRSVADRGPVLLVGHSLGAMTILAHLRRHPATRDRLCGIALVATASSDLAGLGGIARLLPRPLARTLPGLARTVPRLFESVWGAARALMSPTLGNCAHRDRPSVQVLAELLTSILALDEEHSLKYLRTVPSLVVAGGRDIITPPAHAQHLADTLPLSRLRIIERGGHNLPLTHPADLSAAVAGLFNTRQRETATVAPTVPLSVSALVATP